MKMPTPEKEREAWLEEVRAALTRARELHGDKGKVPVRSTAEGLNWLIEQVGPEAAAQLELIVMSDERR